jgi:hypothetical protein
MTLPNERYAAVTRTEQFLRDLMDPKKTPRVPRDIRQQAYYCLRHYPSKWNMDVVATRTPSVFETDNPIDDLSQLIFNYEAKKK